MGPHPKKSLVAWSVPKTAWEGSLGLLAAWSYTRLPFLLVSFLAFPPSQVLLLGDTGTSEDGSKPG